jgi:hypothetical protein
MFLVFPSTSWSFYAPSSLRAGSEEPKLAAGSCLFASGDRTSFFDELSDLLLFSLFSVYFGCYESLWQSTILSPNNIVKVFTLWK